MIGRTKRTAALQRARIQERPPQRPGPPEGPPQPPPPEPTSHALAPTPSGADITLAGGMPGQREGRPTTLNEAALQVTLKWMDHMSDAAELALGDADLAEAQAHSVVTFFGSVYRALQPHFPEKADADKEHPRR